MCVRVFDMPYLFDIINLYDSHCIYACMVFNELFSGIKYIQTYKLFMVSMYFILIGFVGLLNFNFICTMPKMEHVFFLLLSYPKSKILQLDHHSREQEEKL